MLPSLELVVPARPEYIAMVRLVVASLATARRNLADQRVDDIKLAVSEACTNAIEAHAAAGVDKPVTVLVVEGAERIEILIVDHGLGFDPDDLLIHPPPNDPERLNFERGLGIPLIRTLVDDVEFRSSGEGTTVRMVVFGGPADEAGDDTVQILRSVLAEEE
jgi:serine/threonine-protein kinase RsbW